jgi:saccharopine dehydrogenase-like NADP-dependent oxidoreductase
MKATIVGAGAQGAPIAFLLSRAPEVDEVVITDNDSDRLGLIRDLIASDKVSAQRIDAGNVDDVVKVCRGKNVVVNATIPEFNLTILEAALKAGSNYIDLAAGPTDKFGVEQTLEMELQQSQKWKDAGLTAVIDQGGPFVLSACMRYAADQMDQVEEIHMRHGMRPRSGSEAISKWSPTWSPLTELLEWAQRPLVFENGEMKRVEPFTGFESYRFPEPIGEAPMCYLENERVVTLPRFIGKGLKRVDQKRTPPVHTGILIKTGFARPEPINVKGNRVVPRDVLLSLVGRPVDIFVQELRTKRYDPSLVYLDIVYGGEIIGSKNGHRVSHTYWIPRTEREGRRWFEKFGLSELIVAIPAVVNARMFARHEIEVKGVVPVEALEPKPFLNGLAEYEFRITENITREIPPAT